MKIIKNIRIQGSRQRDIYIDLFVPETKIKAPVIVFSHGFKGFKDWGHFNLLAKNFCRENFIYMKFNFSYNGTNSDHLDDVYDKEAFGQNNLSTELNDLGCIIDFIFSQNFPAKEGFNSELYLIGHSRGGAISILKAAEDRRVKKVLTLAAVNQFGKFFSEAIVNEWKLKGVHYVENARTKQHYPMYFQYIEDLERNAERLNVNEALNKMKAALLIIHGTKDEAVNVKSAYKIKEMKPEAELILIDNANHTFGAKHPWDSDELPDYTKFWFEKAIAFFRL